MTYEMLFIVNPYVMFILACGQYEYWLSVTGGLWHAVDYDNGTLGQLMA